MSYKYTPPAKTVSEYDLPLPEDLEGLKADLAKYEARIKHFWGYSWNDPVAEALVNRLRRLEARIKELEGKDS